MESSGTADPCIFCSIVVGESPAERVYDDGDVIGIMDIHPATEGHVVVLPKNHSRDLWSISVEEAHKVMAAATKVARMIRENLQPDGVNLVHASGEAAWQTVFHFHVHVVPRYRDDGLVPPWSLQQARVDYPALKTVAERIRQPRAGTPSDGSVQT